MNNLIQLIKIVILFFTMIVLVSCEGIKRTEEKRDKGIEHSKAETILRIHGSNTIGADLMPALVKKWMVEKGASGIIEIAGNTPEEKSITGKFNGKSVSVEIHCYGSSTGFNDLVWNKCDLAMSSKPIPDEAVSKLKSFGDMRSAECEHILALDGIAIIVNKSMAFENIDIPTLKKIFSGEINNWMDVGLQDGKINVYRRDNNSGTHEVFRKLVMKKEKMKADAVVCLDNKELSVKIKSDENAIGYASVTFTGDNRSLKIKGVGNSLFEATPFTVQTEDYPLSRRLFLYKPEKSKNAYLDDLVEYTLSRSGQKEVERSGFIAQTLRLEKPSLDNNTPLIYRKNVGNSLRLSMNFRFVPGSSRLDNRSLRDINRFLNFVEEEKLQKSSIKLFGFSDNMGDSKNNRILSYKRARNVAQILENKAEINVAKIRGFGDIMPVASNDTFAGRVKNRRVEVWMDFTTEG